MKARELVESILRRPQAGVADNMRFITREQMVYVLDLIAKDEEAAALRRGAGNSFVWSPSGRDRYVVTEDFRPDRHTLTKVKSLVPEGVGSLF